MKHVTTVKNVKNHKLKIGGSVLIKPLGLNVSAYAAVFNNPNILRGCKNTLIRLVPGVMIGTVKGRDNDKYLNDFPVQSGEVFREFGIKIHIYGRD